MTHGRPAYESRRSVAATRACTSTCRSYTVDFSLYLSSSRAETRPRDEWKTRLSASPPPLQNPYGSFGGLTSPQPALNIILRYLACGKVRTDRHLLIIRNEAGRSSHAPSVGIVELLRLLRCAWNAGCFPRVLINPRCPDESLGPNALCKSVVANNYVGSRLLL